MLQGMADALSQAKTGYKAMQELERVKQTWSVTTGDIHSAVQTTGISKAAYLPDGIVVALLPGIWRTLEVTCQATVYKASVWKASAVVSWDP